METNIIYQLLRVLLENIIPLRLLLILIHTKPTLSTLIALERESYQFNKKFNN